MIGESLRFLVAAAVFSVALFGLALLLSGCAETEGAGFSNGGRGRDTIDCRRVFADGREVWFSIPAGEKCPAQNRSR